MTRSPSSHGGRRPGAGRPKGEPTVRLRVPTGVKSRVRALIAGYRADADSNAVPVASDAPPRRVPYFIASVPAGFPSPAEQYLEEAIDLNVHLIRAGHEAATYMIRVSGSSMIGAGIHDGDELVVDRAEEKVLGRVVVAVHDGAMTVKRLRRRGGKPVLVAENPDYPERVVAEGEEFEIWGVVTKVLHTP
ncbi:MAG: translesion error-prone DNA polymerase V autoproteolytic subunit [Gammaproteobacteria bacterium]|nr:translesion error-prone DNA polymerase V autoproteolytic subunit [Gammaproteobacteria bacterium]